ncbi:DNA primase [Candidatus Berkelbacteria bacterium]|nr:DNA primase [Candidatus Berkelbacteria bacterium]
MAENQVQEIKERVDVVDFIGQYVPLKRAGNNHKGLCPFHTEKSPSFMVNQERQIFKCFGCNESGDVLTFLQKMEGLSFPEALEMLADRVGVKLDRKKAPAQYQKEKDEKTVLYRLNTAAAKFFHHLLLKHASGAVALAYLKTRKVTEETIIQFQLGYAPDKPVLATWLKKYGLDAQALRLAGSPERFRNRIIFPIRDALGNTVGFTGRSLPGDTIGPKYYNTPETPIFKKGRILYGLHEGKQAIKQTKTAILVEGQMDVVLSHQVGILTAIASSGTALTLDHLKILARYTPSLDIAFDADTVGIAAAKKAIALALEAELTVQVIQLPMEIKDAGEAIEQDPAIWQAAVQSPQPALEWLIQRSIVVAGILDGAKKKLVAREILPYINLISDLVERDHYLKLLARRMMVSEAILHDAFKRMNQKPPRSQSALPVHPQSVSQRSLEEQLVGLILFQPDLIEQIFVSPKLLVKSELASRLFQIFKTWYTAGRQSLLKTQFKPEDQKDINALLLETETLVAQGVQPKELAQEFHDRLQAKNREILKESMAVQIAEAEATGDRNRVKTLIIELQNLLAK